MFCGCFDKAAFSCELKFIMRYEINILFSTEVEAGFKTTEKLTQLLERVKGRAGPGEQGIQIRGLRMDG